MDTATLVTNVLLYQENLPSATTGDFVRARARCKRNAQRAVNKVWQHRPWSCRTVGADVPVANGEGVLTSFANFGRDGGVYLPGLRPLRWVPRVVMDQLQAGPPNTGTPEVYSTYSKQDGTMSLLVFPTGAATLTCIYNRTHPVLVDDTDGMDDEGTDELQLIPEDYHETVIYEWTVYFQMKDKANQQSVTEQLRLAKEGLQSMVENERQGIQAAHNVVPYGTRRR